jgi:hypothetical protein
LTIRDESGVVVLWRFIDSWRKRKAMAKPDRRRIRPRSKGIGTASLARSAANVRLRMTANFSWKRGLKHAAIPAALFLVAGAALATQSRDPEKLGEGMGRLLIVVIGAALGASYLWQTGKRRIALAVGIGVCALIGGLTAASLATWHAHRPLVRVPLLDVTEDGTRWLRHPELGFAVKHPGADYIEAPELAAVMGNGDPDTVYYAYADAARTAVLTIGVMNDIGATRAALDDAIVGIERGLRAQVGATSIVDRQLMWDDHHHEARLHAMIASAHCRVAAFAFPGRSPPLVVVVNVISQAPDALADVLRALRSR